jgi:hypothetical protein
LFRKVLAEMEFEITEDKSWQAGDLRNFKNFEATSPEEEVIKLSERKILLFLNNGKWSNKIIVSFHSAAIFDGTAVESSQTPSELERTIVILNGHVYHYFSCISMAIIGEDGQLDSSLAETVTIYPEVGRLPRDDIKSFVNSIPPDKIVINSPGCYPLVGGFRQLLVEPQRDVVDYKRSMKRAIQQLFEKAKNKLAEAAVS